LSLALSTLIYEWRRYLGAVIALGLAGVLVLAEVGFFMGIGKSVTATIDAAPAEIMIMGPHSESLLNDNGRIPRRIQPILYMNPQVTGVAEMTGNGGQLSNDPGPGKKKKQTNVQIWGVDPYPGSLTMPRDFDEATRMALMEPYGIVVGKASLSTMGLKLGDYATINGKKVHIAAVVDGYTDIMNPTVISSRQTMRLIASRGPDGPMSGPLYVRIKDPAKAEQVRDQLNAAARGQYRAWTRQELSRANEGALFKESAVGILMGFSVVVGIIIGIAITSQTMRGAIMANIKEFASLRALGVSMGSLRVSILELSFWVGIAGLGMTALLVSGVSLLAAKGGVVMAFPPPAVTIIAAFLMVISIVSGLMALGVLKKSQPADLLR
jgi:putative ABC transport system permease protein